MSRIGRFRVRAFLPITKSMRQFDLQCQGEEGQRDPHSDPFGRTGIPSARVCLERGKNSVFKEEQESHGDATSRRGEREGARRPRKRSGLRPRAWPCYHGVETGREKGRMWYNSAGSR